MKRRKTRPDLTLLLLLSTPYVWGKVCVAMGWNWWITLAPAWVPILMLLCVVAASWIGGLIFGALAWFQECVQRRRDRRHREDFLRLLEQGFADRVGLTAFRDRHKHR